MTDLLAQTGTYTAVDHDLSCVVPAEDLSDGEEVLPKEIAKWNSNDLMDKIEAAEAEETPGMTKTTRTLSRTVTLRQYLRMCLCVCRWAVQGNDFGLWKSSQWGKTRWGMCVWQRVFIY